LNVHQLEHFVETLQCGCGGSTENGAIGVAHQDIGPERIFLRAICAGCGYVGSWTVAMEPCDCGDQAPAITADETIDVHQALKDEHWLQQITGRILEPDDELWVARQVAETYR
jgi:hypothetical protein